MPKYSVTIDVGANISNAKAAMKDLQQMISNIKLPDKLKTDFSKSFTGLEDAIKDFETKQQKGVSNKKEASVLTASYDNVVREFERVSQVVDKIKAETNGAIDLSNFIKIDGTAQAQIEGLTQDIANLQNQLNSLNTDSVNKLEKAMDGLKTPSAKGKAASALDIFKNAKDKKDIEAAIQLLEKAQKSYNGLLGKDGGKGLDPSKMTPAQVTAQNTVEAFKNMIQIMQEFETKSAGVQGQIDAKVTERTQTTEGELNRLKEQLNGVGDVFDKAGAGVKDMGDGFKEGVESMGQFGSELDQMKSRIQYFFGLANAINLVKRAVRSAFDTVKDLDSAMTETAVVTNYTIKDMWSQLPEYTERANKLGVSTKSAYESATLYYQQGLNSDQAAALSTETLKMARIAGLDAAEATDRMTNALRGFNMELDASSAQRVDDVYSQLAAMSASNVDEISTAMTKVASLANNANMEFETTSAFLAQIIETTRESAETAGTALKTVVARFSEVKDLYEKDELKGQDEEGQVVDVNRVSQALRTAGIDLNKYFLGEVGLDDIFMELASKWDSLTNVQQRYIATQAAGSRQQSRFIALMQDYSRTQELVSAAYDSEGASEKQFEKTQDSLESKLARLSNAWNEFLMGLANNGMIKGVVDGLTTILNIVNKITSSFGSGFGSIAKWGVAIGGLFGAKSLFNNGGLVDKALTSVLSNTVLGSVLGFKGAGQGATPQVSGGGAAPTGGGGVRIGTGGIGNFFGSILERRQERQKKWNGTTIFDAAMKPKGFTGQGKEFETFGGLGGLGVKLSKTGLGQKLAGTKAASSIASALGLGTAGGAAGTGGAGAAAVAGLGVGLIYVAAAAAAAFTAYKLWENFTPEGHVKKAKEFAEAMKQVETSANQAKKATADAYDTYAGKTKVVDEAKNSKEWEKSVKDRNEYLNELIQQSPEYAQYLKTDFQNGQLVLSIDEKDMAQIRDKAAEGAEKAGIASGLAQAMQSGAESESYRAKISRAGVNLEAKTIRVDDGNGSYYDRAMTAKEIQTYTNYAIQAEQKSIESKNRARAQYAQMIENTPGIEDVGDDVANLISGALAETFDETKYLREIQSQHGGTWFNWMRGRGHWQEEYRKAYGVEADTNMKTADIARAVAQAGAQVKEQEKTDNVAELVEANESLVPILKIFNKDFEDFEGDYNKAFENLDTDAFVALAKELDIAPNKFLDVLEQNIKEQQKVTKENQKTLAKKGFFAGFTGEELETLVEKYPERIDDFLNISDTAEKALGESGFSNFMRNLTEYSDEEFSKIVSMFSGLDLGEPISAFHKLKEAADDANSTVADLANSILSTNSDTLFDTGYLTQVFYTSSAFDGISDSLDKFIEENGRISAANLEELAGSCAELGILLDEAGVSAQGLAKALTAVKKGEADVSGMTTRVVEALGSDIEATTRMEQMFKNIDEATSTIDYNKPIEFALNQISEIENALENLDVGTQEFQVSFKYLTNEEEYQNFIEQDFEGRYATAQSLIERYKGLLENDALGAMQQLAGGATGITGDETGTRFAWDVRGKTWDTLTQQIQQELGVNEQVAGTIITSAAKHIPYLIEQLDLNSFIEQLRNFGETVQGDAVITEQELQVMAASAGVSVDEVKSALEKLNASQGYNLPIIVSWQNENGQPLTDKDLKDKFEETFGELKDFVDKNELQIKVKPPEGIFGPQLGINTVDADEFSRILQEQYKLSEAQSKNLVETYAKDNGIQLSRKFTNIEYNSEQDTLKKVENRVTGSTFEELEANVKLALDQSEAEMQASAFFKQFSNADVTIVPKGLDEARKTIVSTLGQDVGVNITPSFGEIPSSGSGGGTPNNIYGSGGGHAAGGRVHSYANGSRHITAGVALTGEEGPELVWNKERGYAYLVGGQGPEFANLIPGDQVFPADQTSKIIKRGVMPSYASGKFPSYDAGNSKKKNKKLQIDEQQVEEGAWVIKKEEKPSGGSGDKKKDDEFKMDLDKYYNMVEDINELLRLRELLEKDYNQLLQKEAKSGKEIYDNLNKQLDLLEERRKIVEELAENRKQQILDLIEENQELTQFAWWNDEDSTIEIDWELTNSIDDKEKGGEVKNYLSKLEDFQSKYDEQIEALEEIEDAVQEIRERGKDQYNSLEERTRDALIKAIQDRIDELSDVEEAINDTNQKLFNSMQETLQQQRQERGNAETEKELSDKEKRLAYLQQDSSNANALEIAQLQEELADARQDYTDNLIDQKISELQKQNEEASEQRQQQIDLMQRSLDWQEKSGAFWETVYQYISEGTDAVGALVHESELEKLLKTAETWDQLSEEQKKSWAQELIDQVAQGIAYLELTRQLEDIGTKEGTKISFTVPSGETLTGTVDKNGNVVVKNSDGSTTTYKDIFQDYHGQYRTFEENGEVKKPATNTKKLTGTSSAEETSGDNGNGAKRTVDTKWTYNESTHWHKVFYDGKESKERADEAAHDFKASFNAVNKDQLKYTCTICGYVKNLISPANISNISEEVETARGGLGKEFTAASRTKTIVEGTATINNEANLRNAAAEKQAADRARAEQAAEQARAEQEHNAAVAKILNAYATGDLATMNALMAEDLKKKKYASGGLNTQAGPAWLDGTLSKPELVLNARDTQNFIELKDVLADMRKNGGLYNLNGGDNYYNINVNVDQMSSDYDVDRAIDRIKTRLAQDGAYRNVNTLSRLR